MRTICQSFAPRLFFLSLLLLGLSLAWWGRVVGAPPADRGEPACCAVDDFFAEEVWAKVGERTCLKCHNAGGDASDSEFLLQSTVRSPGAIRKNLEAFARMAAAQEDGASRLLLKVAGRLDHGGGEVLKAGSTGLEILQKFVRRRSAATGQPPASQAEPLDNAPPYFDGVRMMSPERLLRRITLSLAARLPSEEERAAVDKRGSRRWMRFSTTCSKKTLSTIACRKASTTFF